MARDWNPNHRKIIETVPGYVTVYSPEHLHPPTIAWCSGDEVIAAASTRQQLKRVFVAHLYNFAYGSCALQPAHMAFLDAKVMPRVFAEGLNVDVYGFAGDTGSARRRAASVADFFVSQRDVEDSQVGYLYEALAPVGPRGRAIDRAVLLTLVTPQ